MNSNELRQAIADAHGNPEALTRLIFQEHRAAQEAQKQLADAQTKAKLAERLKTEAQRLQNSLSIALNEVEQGKRKLGEADATLTTKMLEMKNELGALCACVWFMRATVQFAYGTVAKRMHMVGMTKTEFDKFFRDIANPDNFDPTKFAGNKLSIDFSAKIAKLLERRYKIP